MALKVEPCFDYANTTIDFKEKNVKFTYPYRSPKSHELILFILHGLVPVIIAGFFITIIITFIFPDRSPYLIIALALVMSIGGWFYLCYHTDYVRKEIITMYENECTTNQIYIQGIKKRKIRIRNVGNYLTEYYLYGDYKKFISKIEIKCLYCKVKNKKAFVPDVSYEWVIDVEFSRVPRKGRMIFMNKLSGGRSDEVNKKINNGYVDIDYM